ncbi:MAG: phenylacetate--CoA ligase, partial [Armatimonadota bacterium]|nr:phenylacetate--CoA ligase [Armatimonadota bacterium]
TRDDLLGGYPYDMFAVPLRDVVRLHSTSGTTGAPIVCGYTAKDLDNWTELVARVLVSGGVGKEDVVQVSFGHGMFAAGFGFQYGAERIGASVIPVSGEGADRQISIMRDYRTTVLVGTPTYALWLSEALKDTGINPKALSLRAGIFGGEPWSEKVRAEIEARLEIFAIDSYGLSEVMTPGVSWECECKTGLHIAEDNFIAEVVDPKTGNPMPPGCEGELVLTTLTKEALPLIRYRTRDITSLDFSPCACGRTLARMSRVHSRTDDMIIVQGVNIFPSQIEAVLTEVEGIKPHYQLILDRKGATDDLEIQVEVSEDLFSDQVSELVDLEQRLKNRIQSALGISPRIRLVEPRTLERAKGRKRRVVIDRRKI